MKAPFIEGELLETYTVYTTLFAQCRDKLGELTMVRALAKILGKAKEGDPVARKSLADEAQATVDKLHAELPPLLIVAREQILKEEVGVAIP